MGHTPGPWKITSRSFSLSKQNIIFFNVASDHKAIAKVINLGQYRKGSRDESEANAALIAAAPEMLKVLEMIEKAIEQDESGGQEYDSHCRVLGPYVISAINKAKGGS